MIISYDLWIYCTIHCPLISASSHKPTKPTSIYLFHIFPPFPIVPPAFLFNPSPSMKLSWSFLDARSATSWIPKKKLKQLVPVSKHKTIYCTWQRSLVKKKNGNPFFASSKKSQQEWGGLCLSKFFCWILAPLVMNGWTDGWRQCNSFGLFLERKRFGNGTTAAAVDAFLTSWIISITIAIILVLIIITINNYSKMAALICIHQTWKPSCVFHHTKV